jgi:hypothetical protein
MILEGWPSRTLTAVVNLRPARSKPRRGTILVFCTDNAGRLAAALLAEEEHYHSAELATLALLGPTLDRHDDALEAVATVGFLSFCAATAMK